MCWILLRQPPLLLAWELSQLWKLYRAAEELLEDTLVDLVVELQPHVHISDLLHALHTTTEVGLSNRINSQRHDRGPAGGSASRTTPAVLPIEYLGQTPPH